MRNAIDIGAGMIVTTDNAGGIGEKVDDVVFVADRVTAYFAARVALLEQWAANAEPTAVLIHNFSGDDSWVKYVQGVSDLFDEVGIEVPPISGSTETNMPLLQSAVAVTMIGQKKRAPSEGKVSWFTYGTPLVGDEVITRAADIASVKLIYKALKKGIVERVWPVGSHGILNEVHAMTRTKSSVVKSIHNLEKSAGPSTVVLLAIQEEKRELATDFLGELLQDLFITIE